MGKMEGWIYFSYDADNAGRRVGKAILSDDPSKLQEVSDKIQLGNQLIHRWARERGAIMYSSGGDQGVYAIPEQYEKHLEALRRDYSFLTGMTISIGVGHHLSESGQALLIAKLKGKDRIVNYDKNTKKEIEKIRKRSKKRKFKTMEEQKIAESYLDKTEKLEKGGDTGRSPGASKELHEVVEKPDTTEDDCEYCNQTDGVDPDHCKYCHDEDPAEGEESCPYCQELNPDGKPDPASDGGCPYCSDKTAETGEDKCKYCGYDRPGSDNLDFPELADQDDQFGKEKEIYENRDHKEQALPLVSPDSNNDQSMPGSKEEKELYNGVGMNPPEIGKPPPPDKRPPIGQGPTAEARVVTEDRGAAAQVGNGGVQEDPNQRLDDQRDVQEESIQDPDESSNEALMGLAQQLEAEEKPNDNNRDNIGAENIPSGDHMEDNVSRPDGFEQTTPGDTGMEGENQVVPEEDDEPDMKSILEEGLDNHADGIQRQKAVQAISQALMQFKAAKQSLELSKDQMPQLYQASIGILKAMIEMASMLGLNQGQPSQSTPQLGEAQQAITPEVEAAPTAEPENEWHEPFPSHPDQGGEAKPGHAPSSASKSAFGGDEDKGSKEGGIIGQSIKKLPTSATTPHIARDTMPVGAVNAKGQQKVMDDQGKIRFISRKQGMVQGQSGVPVKPPKK